MALGNVDCFAIGSQSRGIALASVLYSPHCLRFRRKHCLLRDPDGCIHPCACTSPRWLPLSVPYTGFLAYCRRYLSSTRSKYQVPGNRSAWEPCGVWLAVGRGREAQWGGQTPAAGCPPALLTQVMGFLPPLHDIGKVLWGHALAGVQAGGQISQAGEQLVQGGAWCEETTDETPPICALPALGAPDVGLTRSSILRDTEGEHAGGQP